MGKVECLVYLVMHDDSGKMVTTTEVLLLDLDEDIEDQVFGEFPGIESFSWVELSEVM